MSGIEVFHSSPLTPVTPRPAPTPAAQEVAPVTGSDLAPAPSSDIVAVVPGGEASEIPVFAGTDPIRVEPLDPGWLDTLDPIQSAPVPPAPAPGSSTGPGHGGSEITPVTPPSGGVQPTPGTGSDITPVTPPGGGMQPTPGNGGGDITPVTPAPVTPPPTDVTPTPAPAAPHKPIEHPSGLSQWYRSHQEWDEEANERHGNGYVP